MTVDEAAATVRHALEAAYHIAECGGHPGHLLAAENAARKALPALDVLVAAAHDRDRLAGALADIRSSFGICAFEKARAALADDGGAGCDCGAPRCERDGCQDKPTPQISAADGAAG